MRGTTLDGPVELLRPKLIYERVNYRVMKKKIIDKYLEVREREFLLRDHPRSFLFVEGYLIFMFAGCTVLYLFSKLSSN